MNETIEQIIATAKEWMNILCDATQKGIDLGKVEYETLKAKNEVEKLYNSFGKIAYQLEKGTLTRDDGIVSNAVAEISALEEAIELLDEEKKIIKARKCGETDKAEKNGTVKEKPETSKKFDFEELKAKTKTAAEKTVKTAGEYAGTARESIVRGFNTAKEKAEEFISKTAAAIAEKKAEGEKKAEEACEEADEAVCSAAKAVEEIWVEGGEIIKTAADTCEQAADGIAAEAEKACEKAEEAAEEAKEAVKEAPVLKFCPSCGAGNPSVSEKCMNCGTVFE